jgi:hypothetical protein
MATSLTRRLGSGASANVTRRVFHEGPTSSVAAVLGSSTWGNTWGFFTASPFSSWGRTWATSSGAVVGSGGKPEPFNTPRIPGAASPFNTQRVSEVEDLLLMQNGQPFLFENGTVLELE